MAGHIKTDNNPPKDGNMMTSMAGGDDPATERPEMSVAAQRRRRALESFIRANQLEPTQWARDAGLKSANAIYNFLKGRSSSLNSETYERLAGAVPGATVAQLVGERVVHRPALSHNIRIREIASAGTWLKSPELPSDEQEACPIPEGAMKAQGAFGVRLNGEDMDLDWPPGTLFVAVPFLMSPEPVENSLILLHRVSRERRFEVTVRELRRDPIDRKRGWLWPRSSRPEYQTPIACSWPLEGAFEEGGERVEPTAVVIGACLRLDASHR